jgi:hypothetical protein
VAVPAVAEQLRGDLGQLHFAALQRADVVLAAVSGSTTWDRAVSLACALALSAAFGACATRAPRSMLEIAFDHATSFPWVDSGDGGEDDIGALQRREVQLAEVTAELLGDGRHGHIFVCHTGWTVIVFAMDRSLRVTDARSFHAKLGFSIRWRDGDLVITLHEHPGTGMFVDTALRVRVEAARLVIARVDESPPK